MKKNKFKLLSFMLAVIMSLLVMLPTAPVAYAADKHITVEEFAKELAKEVGLGSVSDGGVNALISAGIIKEGDFKSYSAYLTRGDATMLLSRADEYLYGDKIDPELVQTVIDKRISDINKIAKAKREDVAKGYIKGFMKGYSNGTYSSDRELRGTKKITRAGALNTIKMIKDKSLRAKISPDGQLIRTTKLPKYAKYYPYILASFPNEYYDWTFLIAGGPSYYYDRELDKHVYLPFNNLEQYAYPVDVDKITSIENFKELYDKNLDLWVERTRRHMELIFNVDYRELDESFISELLSTMYPENFESYREEHIRKWIDRAKANKTIIEASDIKLDGSAMYFYKDDLYMRVYVRYRIVSSEEIYDDELGYTRNYNALFATPLTMKFDGFNIGEWRECCFDVRLTKWNGDFYVIEPYIWEQLYTQGKPK